MPTDLGLSPEVPLILQALGATGTAVTLTYATVCILCFLFRSKPSRTQSNPEPVSLECKSLKTDCCAPLGPIGEMGPIGVAGCCAPDELQTGFTNRFLVSPKSPEPEVYIPGEPAAMLLKVLQSNEPLVRWGEESFVNGYTLRDYVIGNNYSLVFKCRAYGSKLIDIFIDGCSIRNTITTRDWKLVSDQVLTKVPAADRQYNNGIAGWLYSNFKQIL